MPSQFARVHPVDRLFGRLVGRAPIFAAGWGDLDGLGRLLTDTPFLPTPGVITPRFGSARVEGGIEHLEGEFTSPVAELPADVARARVLWLRPPGGRRGRAACVLLAGSRDEGSRLRHAMFAKLVHDGIDLLVLENPYYGSRRPSGQAGAALRTVAEHLQMNVASVEEARALVRWLRATGYAQAGVAGYSMGGYMAALVAASMPEAIPAAVLAAGRSPAPVFTEGLLTRGIDFAALGETRADPVTARARLTALFDRAALDRFPPLRTGAHAVIVGCAQDGYVPRSETLALHAHWPTAELRWLAAGHVSALFTQRAALRAAVRDAFGTSARSHAS